MVEALRNPIQEVNISLVGKYTQLHDAYISVVEALKHGGIAERATVNHYRIKQFYLLSPGLKDARNGIR